MSQRAVWILAALAALLVGYVLLFERTSVTTRELEQRQGRVLTAFVRERVDGLELQRAGKSVVLERKPLEDGALGMWKMLEPVATEADQDAVDQVLGELEWLSARRTLENLSAADEKAFGLSAPRYRIWYRVGGERHMLAVGNPDVHGQGVYVRTDDSKQAYVVPKTLTEALDHPAGHFRAKEFLGDMVTSWARKIELGLADAGTKLLLSRAEDGRWWVELSGQGSAEFPRGYADQVDGLLSALNDLKAARYLEEGPLLTGAKVALAKPDITVRVSILPDEKREDQTPRLIELRVAGPCPEHPSERLAQAGEKGAVVCVADDALKPFAPDIQGFRQRALLSVDPSQMEAFELSAGARKLSLKRDGEKWLSQGKEAIDREAVESWLRADLAALKATAFQPLSEGAEAGGSAREQNKESARLSVTLAGSKQETVVMFAPGPDGSVRVKRGDEPLLAVFPASLSNLLDPAPNRFTSLSPWTEQQPSEIASVEARADKLERSLALVNGAWSVAGKALAPEAELRVREIVKTLLKLRTLAYVTEHARPEHGLSTPRASAVFARKALADKPASTLRLELGADSPRGLYARFDSGPVLEVEGRVLGLVRELAGGAPTPVALNDAGAAHDEEDDEEGDPLHTHEH